MDYLWVVGQVFPENQNCNNWEFIKQWEIQGIFDSEPKALECINGYLGDCFFIGRAELNLTLPIDSREWQLSWFPKLESKPNEPVPVRSKRR